MRIKNSFNVGFIILIIIYFIFSFLIAERITNKDIYWQTLIVVLGFAIAFIGGVLIFNLKEWGN